MDALVAWLPFVGPFAFFLMWILLVLGVLILLPYLGGPVLIRLTLKQAAEPRLMPFPLDDPTLPNAVAHAFQTVVERLRPAGFEPITGLGMPSQAPNVKALVMLLVNRQAKDIAVAAVMYARTPGATPATSQLRTFYVELVSHFRNGSVVQTNNSSELTVFGPRPTHIVGRFPAVKDAGRLYRLHQGMVARSGLRDKVFRLDEEFGGEAAAAVAASMVEELKAQVKTGYMYLSAGEDAYRPTWKGAVLMTWKLLWPVKAIRRAARDRTARRLMAELEGRLGKTERVQRVRRLPRRFYGSAAGFLLCVAAAVLGISMLHAVRAPLVFLTLLVCVPIAIFFARNAVNIARVSLLPSPEKRAAESRAREGAPGRSVDAFLDNLETSPTGHPEDGAADGPAERLLTARGRGDQSSWDLAEPVAVGQGEWLPVRLRASPYKDNLLPLLGFLYLVFFVFIGLSASLRRMKDASAFAFVAGAGAAAVIVYACWRQVRRVSKVVVEVSDHPLRAGECHEIIVCHSDLAALPDVRLKLVAVEQSGEGKHSETRTVLREPILLTPLAEPGSAWTGQVEVPPTAVSFVLRRHRVTWRLEVRLARWSPWVAHYPVEIGGPAAAGDLPAPDDGLPRTRMDVDDLSLWIHGDTAVFLPGDVLTGGFQVHAHGRAGRLGRVELSVLWEAGTSRGSGRRAGRRQPRPAVSATWQPQRQFMELGICFFEEYEAAGDDDSALYAPRQFRTVLPDGPPSFGGQVFQVGWAVRLRLRYRDGDEITRDLPFVLAPDGEAEVSP
jgi:hypothetical protein